MKHLSAKESELVAVGAALASNCIPCTVYHFTEAKKLGISEEQLREAIELAVRIRKAPADRVVETAMAQLHGASGEPEEQEDAASSKCCC